MKQRISVLVALLVVLSMVLSACGGGAAPAAAPAETAARPQRAAGETTQPLRQRLLHQPPAAKP